jgi:DNA invertase Pin-like site-specific DNA recombinase
MKCAIYLRCSTSEQDTENQLSPLWTLAAARGWEVGAIYRENESAWKANHQPELARLLIDAAGRQYDIILVFALDRLTRQGPASILNLVNTFAVYGCKVISFNESWTEMPGIAGEIMLAIAGWTAKMESDRKSQNTLAGLAKAQANGGGKRGPDKEPGKRKRRWLKRPVSVTPSVFVSPSVATKRL